jgi:hypothetical protein
MDLLDRLCQAARRRAVLDDVDGRVDFPLGQLRPELLQCAPLAGRVAPNSPPDIRSISDPPGLTAATTSGASVKRLAAMPK